jgi:hypothetical protein
MAMVGITEFLVWSAYTLVPVILSLVIVLVLKPVVFLKRDEQLLLEKLSDKEIQNGPGVCFIIPIITRATVRKATLLEELDYIDVTDTLSGVQRVEEGPHLVFVGAYETVGHKCQKHVLEKDEYIKVRDAKNGQVRVVQGPSVFVPTPTESTPDGKKKGVSLEKHEYVRITDTTTGLVRIEKGDQLVFPGPMDVMESKQAAWKLRRNEYIKLIDTATGQIRVERGEKIVFPTPTEDTRGQGKFAQVTSAVEINDDTAVLVESKETGQQRLVKDSGMFFPGPHDEILEVRKLIRVEPHEVAIVQNKCGEYTFHGGSSEGRGTAFFLQPHCELVTMHWGSAASPDEVASNRVASGKKTVNYKVPVTKIDTRSQYAFFEYSVRTSDNVELLLEGTIFWQVVNVPKMIHTTGDPKGDVWFHARSYMIQAVSRVTLEVFMAEFNDIVTKATAEDDSFYAKRGVKMHSLEVTRYACADAATSTVLQEIIQETTNRINRMQKQQSDNDVQRERMNGEIEVETQKTALVQARCDNDRMRAIIEGESEGLRIAKNASTFLSVLGETLPDDASRLELFRFFQDQHESTKRTEHLSSGNAQLFLAPRDMNLKLNMQSP